MTCFFARGLEQLIWMPTLPHGFCHGLNDPTRRAGFNVTHGYSSAFGPEISPACELRMKVSVFIFQFPSSIFPLPEI